MSAALDSYRAFLDAKVPIAACSGFEPPSEPHPSLFGHQCDLARWAVQGGQRAVFAAFGLGKTRIHLQVAKWVTEHTGGRYLIVCPLGVRHVFTREDGPAMDCQPVYCRTDAEIAALPVESRIVVTNYERVRDGAITVGQFAGAGLDEASVLRSFGSKTYQEFLNLFRSVRYRYVFTATPSPNRYKELIHYGGFLGIMDTGEALTRFFKRDSSQANNLTLYPAQEERFWLWLSSWAVFLERPSDLGYDDSGYDLPPLNVEWVCVDVDHTKAWQTTDSWGQAQLFLDQSAGLREVAEARRETMDTRLSRAIDIIDSAEPDRHWLLWHDLEDERRAIEKRLPNVVTVYGSQDLDEREELIVGFGAGKYRILATKPIICGSGCNFQRHCSDAIFLGSTYKFNDFIQAVHRIYRFQQQKPVNIYVIYGENESPVVETLKKKWDQHRKLVQRMAGLVRKNQLKSDMELLALSRQMGVERHAVKGREGLFELINNDVIEELLQRPATIPDASIDLLVTSIPFGNQYEYSPTYNDLGHNPDNAAFFKQMGFLCPELLRVMKPGRVAAIHVKDRIRFGNVTGKGMPTVEPFSDHTVTAFTEAGFAYMGRITIDTDVVRENNQTYRLSWSEKCKDGTKMGVGMPEYVLLFRRLPSDTSDGYADDPVTHAKADYTRAQWQIDASSLWKSSGDRLPDPEYLLHLPHDTILELWRERCRRGGYDYREHVEIGRELEKMGKLPASFMLFPPVSTHPDIWTDIARMRTLNSEQTRRNEEQHVCPLQLDIIDRLIERYSNPGELVFDPFMGIGSTGYVAVKKGRRAIGTELNAEYWRCSVGYLEMAENEVAAPTLFDVERFTREPEGAAA
jgi:DNA modification methylase